MSRGLNRPKKVKTLFSSRRDGVTESGNKEKKGKID